MQTDHQHLLREVQTRSLANCWDSVRRYFVDDFYTKKVGMLDKGPVLDLGGLKKSKKGMFNIEDLGLNVVYVNYNLASFPDIGADAHFLPLQDNSFETVICSELLEHLKCPGDALMEIGRVLKTGGRLLLTTPFMYPVHGDPQDFGRYTRTWLADFLAEAGFEEIVIEAQGGYWCVLCDMIRGWMMDKEAGSDGITEKLFNWMNVHLQPMLKKKAIKYDKDPLPENGFFMKGCTTGFGVVCRKK